MRINPERKSVDVEAREINYVLGALIRNYLFVTKNEDPERIIFPMFQSVPHPNKAGVAIPIEWISPQDPIAQEIAENGKDIPEVTPVQEAALDKKDEEIKELKARIEEMKPKQEDTIVPDEPQVSPAPEDLIRQQQEADEPPEPPAESPAKAAFVEPAATPQPPPDRQPKQPPGGDIGPGQGPSDMHPRGRGDQIRTQRDLLEEPGVDEAEEKPFESEIKRDDQGRPIVEDMTEEV